MLLSVQHGLFSAAACAAYGSLFCCCALLLLGCVVPHGLLVTTIAVGAAFGRALGDAAEAVGGAPLNHGVFALVGASAFVAGTSHTTIGARARAAPRRRWPRAARRGGLGLGGRKGALALRSALTRGCARAPPPPARVRDCSLHDDPGRAGQRLDVPGALRRGRARGQGGARAREGATRACCVCALPPLLTGRARLASAHARAPPSPVSRLLAALRPPAGAGERAVWQGVLRGHCRGVWSRDALAG